MHERGHGPAPLPIVLTNGFPRSFLEYLDLLPLLTDTATHGGRAEDAFDVVITSLPGYGFSDRPSAVGAFVEAQARERAQDVAYSRLQSTRPLTVAYGLTDSPAALAAWIVDLFRAFSDCGGDIEARFTRDQILTNLTLYWVTATIGSAMRAYYDHEHFERPPAPGASVEVPAGFAVFADSHRPGAARPPRELAEHAFDVARWTVMPRGGHFAALEEPELLAHELREFFRPLRGSSAAPTAPTAGR